jgi:dTDP-4-dehydrorhamnose 3,5-epimerase
VPFEFEQLEISGLVLIKPKVFKDNRGFFLETYKESDFQKAGIKERFLQENHSRSLQGVLRGLHYQIAPQAQAKLVRCLRGRVLDVAVDIRKGSPTFGRWVMVELSDENHYMLYIPEGFAHGFYVLTEEADILYKVSCEYSPEHERGIAWDDPEIGISWPDDSPILSERDRQLPPLREAEINVYYGERP